MMNWEFRLYLNTSIQLHRTTLWIVLIVWDINNHKTPMDLRIDIDRRNIYKGLVCLYFCSNTQYSTLVFTGIVAAASLPLVPPDTGLTLSQKKFQIFLQLPLTFLFTLLCLGKSTVARKHWQSYPQPARTHPGLSPKLPRCEEKNRIYFKPITWIRKLRTRY